jgi:hypothetical protein
MGTLSLLKDVGVTWFREEDYPVLLEIFEDADKMPRTWNEWLKRAEQMEERAKAQGYRLGGRNSGSSIFQARNVLLMRQAESDSLVFGQQNLSNTRTGS